MQADQIVITALRGATSSRHQAIEALLRLDAASLNRLGRTHYQGILTGFDCFLESWEAQVLEALPVRLHPWFHARSRRPMLERDRTALGLPRPVRALSLSLHGPAAAFGSMYVVEGSALGGQVISRHLRDSLGITADGGGAYFHGFGERTGTMWHEFRVHLEREVREAGPSGVDDACAAAQRTFDELGRTFKTVMHA